MFSQSDDEQQGFVLGLVFAIIAVVIAVVIGISIERRAVMGALQAVQTPRTPPTASSAPPAAAVSAPAVSSAALAPGAAPLSAQAASDAASITVEYGVVKFYFASGKAELAAGASEALIDVVKGARGGKKIIISGFHDAKGNAKFNAELARRRALAVRDALKAAGVAGSQISLQEPEQMAGTGSDAEARRVEIVLQ